MHINGANAVLPEMRALVVQAGHDVDQAGRRASHRGVKSTQIHFTFSLSDNDALNRRASKARERLTML
jgi:hypothetical protein